MKSESHQKKLAFNITYYQVFQNVRNILQELNILLTPDQEHKNQKYHLVRAKLPNVEITGRSESCGKGNCQFMTLYAIQTLLPPKPVVKHLKFKVGYLTVILRRSFII